MINTELTKKQLRQFGLVFGIAIYIVFGVLLPRIFDYMPSKWPDIICIIMFLLAVFIPSRLDTVYKIWMKFGYIMNSIISFLILAGLFYFVITPLAWFMRLIGRDILKLKTWPNTGSYFLKPDKRIINHMENPF